MAQDNVDSSINTHAPSVVQVESNKFVTVVIVISAIALALSAYALAVCNQAKMDAWNAQTQSLLLRDYVDHLRIEMASHGIKPPDYPAQLRGIKP